MPQLRRKIGDIFSAVLSDNSKSYFQFVGMDEAQLYSDVIRVFSGRFDAGHVFDCSLIDSLPTSFYAHVILHAGVKRGFWTKSGNCKDVGVTDVIFRNSSDHGDPSITVSKNWYVWRINEPHVFVGELSGDNRNSEIGVVMPPDSIRERIEIGHYIMSYPSFE